MERILLLMTAPEWADVAAALQSARDSAAAPERLTYGLSLAMEPDEGALQAMHAFGSIQYLCPGVNSWQEVEALWQGEGFLLIGYPAMRFTRHWDMQLLRALGQCKQDGLLTTVLTGYLPRPADPVDAVYPVAAQAFDQDGRLCFHRGTALRYARMPQRSAFLHTDFCFGPAAFFRAMAKEEASPLFLRAYRSKWEVYTLHRPLMHMQWDMPLQPVEVDVEAEASCGGLSRFEKRFNVRFATRQLSAMARQGIFTVDLTFPTHVPVMVRLQEAWRELQQRRSKVNPLCVTALLESPQPDDSLKEEYFSWFARLARLKNMALLAYAEGGMSRQLTPIHPNVLEYKSRYGLPVEGDVPAEEALNYIRLCKPFLLGQSREKMLGHSHYIWLDFGYLRYPVYERASLAWRNLCTDKVTLATVDGVVDTSMIVIPQQHVLPLCREITALCHTSRSRDGCLPEETQLWGALMEAHPDMFHTEELPARRELLTLALTSREEEFHVRA